MKKTYTYDGNTYEFSDMQSMMVSELARSRNDSRLSSVLGMIEGENILDLGCNAGVFTRLIAEKGKKVVGVDILDSIIDVAKSFNQIQGASYVCGDLFELKYPDNTFDCILFLETIEHVDEPTRYLKEFYRILKPGGSLIVSTPNSVSYINILYQIPILTRNGQGKFVDSLKTEQRNTGTQLDHIFLWDFRTLVRYLTRNGFDYSFHKFTGAPSFTVRLGRFPIRIGGKGENRFLLPLLGPYLTTLIIKVKKRS